MKLKHILKTGVFLGLFIQINNASAQKMAEKEFKKNITDIDNSLNMVRQLDPKTYSYDTTLKLPAGKQYGFIVEDFARKYPELVKKRSYSVLAGKNAFRNIWLEEVDMQRLVPVLVGAIKEQQLEIEKLRQEINAIKASR